MTPGYTLACRARTESIAHDVVIWIVCALAVALVLVRPRGIPEWVWATSGAAVLAVFGLVPSRGVAGAIARGTDVYLFLAGMMVLAELARREGLFDWIASHAVRAARGSRFRLFALVYAAGIVVTIVLSNDATAVVLTPAVAAAVRKANAEPLPHLFACAFVANAASFVLPISNPANLVVFAGAMPALARWLAAFALPSVLAIAATFGVLALVSRRDLRGATASDVAAPRLGTNGRVVFGGIAVTAAALVAASAAGAPLGATTFVFGALVFAFAVVREPPAFAGVVRSVSWSVLVLVASLFVLVQGLDATGMGAVAGRSARALSLLPAPWNGLAGAGAAALLSNLVNNLPSGLIAGGSLAYVHGHAAFRAAVAIGIDLGPNLSVTGSLATVLWLTALRREGIAVSGSRFLRAGICVMPPALVAAVLAVRG